MRRELIGYLRDAANGVAFSSEADFDYLVHFVFDDTGHAEPAGMVGATLLSDSEADLLQAFVAAVDRLVASWASQRDITRLDCDGAKAAAQAALDCLLAAGE
jgi:hypothetical protein